MADLFEGSLDNISSIAKAASAIAATITVYKKLKDIIFYI
jgi:hypothetical protein